VNEFLYLELSLDRDPFQRHIGKNVKEMGELSCLQKEPTERGLGKPHKGKFGESLRYVTCDISGQAEI
jgi:hypothetical protein